MILIHLVVSSRCYTAVYNLIILIIIITFIYTAQIQLCSFQMRLKLAKRAQWAPIFNFRWRFVKKRVLRDGYPHKVLNLFAHSSLWETGRKRQAIDTLRGYKIRSRYHVIVFVSYICEYCEIIKILIPITSIYALA